MLPGVTDYNGRAVLDYWTGRPLTRGSYAYYRVGQMTAFAGVEGKPSGNCHFAGEQTSYTFQGYMEGAVKSGERAASEIVADLGRYGSASAPSWSDLAVAWDSSHSVEGDSGEQGAGDPGDSRHHQGRARVDRLREPAGERPADRRRAEEDDRVERHHPAAHAGSEASCSEELMLAGEA